MSDNREQGEFILYGSDDGRSEVQLKAIDGSVWLSQLEMAELFATTKQNVSLHVRNIYKEGELSEPATVKDYLTVQSEGARAVKRKVLLYNLEIILAVGYRVRSPRGTQFRQWATRHLTEYLVKGFVMDDERLKNPSGWDYFDELLARIREIRASEQRFYQKVRELFSLSVDYHNDEQAAHRFFAEVQNKLLYAVAHKTAAEIVVERADEDAPNMNLCSWSGGRVRKQDVIVAKNYLTQDEIDSLNRLVVIFLEQAELRVKGRQQLTLDFWRNNVERTLEFNDLPLLSGSGSISHTQMQSIAHARYEAFDSQRRSAEKTAADADDMQELETLAQQLEQKKGKE